MAAAGETTRQKTGEVTITRTYDVRREVVWAAWTEPERFAQWFGVLPFRTPADRVSMDVRPGGEWSATQVSDEAPGVELPFVGHYRDVKKPERLVFTFENPEDRSDENVEIATLVLRDVDGKTEMTFKQEGHLPPEQYEKLKEGYGAFFDRLEEALALA